MSRDRRGEDRRDDRREGEPRGRRHRRRGDAHHRDEQLPAPGFRATRHPQGPRNLRYITRKEFQVGWYYDYKPYVSVAERRRQAQRELEKRRKKGLPVSPIGIEGRTIA